MRTDMKAPLAMALVALFGIFHGAAHGTERPIDASLIGYTGGFALATALLHAAGIAIVFAAASLSEQHSSKVIRLGGSAVAIAGVALAGAPVSDAF
jgi:urease accessory protein